MRLTGFVALGRGKASRQNLALHCRNLMTLIDGATAIQKQNPVLLMRIGAPSSCDEGASRPATCSPAASAAVTLERCSTCADDRMKGSI